MIVMEPTKNDNVEVTLEDLRQQWGPDDLLDPEEAALYLSKLWGREGFTVEGLRSLRHRINLEPAQKKARMTRYRRSQLDAIREPRRTGRWHNSFESPEN